MCIMFYRYVTTILYCSTQMLTCTPAESNTTTNGPFIETSPDNITEHFVVTGNTTEWFLAGNFEVVTSGNSENGTQHYVNETTDSTSTSSFTIHQEAGVISKTQYESLHHIQWLFIIPTTSLIGVFGNVYGLCFLIFSHRGQSFLLLLLALITTDLVYLFTLLIQSSLEILEHYNKELADYVKCHVLWNLRVVQWIAFSTCTHLITLMAFERLVHIIHPFWVRKSKFSKQTIVVIICMFISNITMRMPAFLTNEPKDISDPNTNLTTCVSVATQWAKENEVGYNHYIVAMLVITQFVPLAATIIANVSIIVILSRHRARRAMLFSDKATRGENYHQFITTLTLIILSGCLTMSLVPNITMYALSWYIPEIYGRNGREYYTEKFVSELSYLIRSCSASSDFIIYILMSKMSRTMLLRFIRKKCCSCLGDEVGLENDSRSKYRSSTADNTEQSETF